MRPSWNEYFMLIAKLVRRHDASVTLIKENNKADGAEVLQISSLGTGPGEQLVLEDIKNWMDARLT